MATATAVDRELDDDDGIAPAEAGGAPAVHKRRGWIKRMYSPLAAAAVVAEKGASAAAAGGGGGGGDGATRRGGWLRRLMAPREHAPLGNRRQRKLGAGSASASSRLLAGLPRRWKRVSVGGGWAAALLDAAAFRVMYVVEAVVLGLALSCFFCCCGCQI